MASTQAKAYRRAKALDSLNRTVRRFSKLYDIDIPDVAAPNLRDPEMGRIAMIEGMDTMLKAILKKADPTPEAEEERLREREERKLFGGRPDLTTETDERVAEVSRSLEAGEAVPAATPPAATSADPEATDTTEEANPVTGAASNAGSGVTAKKPGSQSAAGGKKLSK